MTMPHTILLSDKQKATLASFDRERAAVNARENIYVLAIIEGADGVPEAWQGASVTDAGLVLGDVPAPPAP